MRKRWDGYLPSERQGHEEFEVIGRQESAHAVRGAALVFASVRGIGDHGVGPEEPD
jgi:hypothetical protein